MALPASLQVSAAREDYSLSPLAHVNSTRGSTHATTSKANNFRDTPHQVIRTTDVSHPTTLLVVAAREDNSFSPLANVPSTHEAHVESDLTLQGTLPAMPLTATLMDQPPRAFRNSPSNDGSSIKPSRGAG